MPSIPVTSRAFGWLVALLVGSFAASAAADPPDSKYPFALTDRQATKRALAASADFDGDGHADLLLSGATASPSGFTGAAGIAFGNGRGDFAQIKSRGPIGATEAHVADFDGDGVADIVTAGQQDRQIVVDVSLGLGNGRFARGPTAALPASVDGAQGFYASVRAGDFDGDGDPDVAVRGSESVANLRWQSSSLLPAVETQVVTQDPDRRPAFRLLRNGPLTTGDFNADGILDLVLETAVPETGETGIATLTGTADGGFGQVDTPLGSGVSNGFVASDLDGDGNLDLLGNGSDLTGSSANLLARYGAGDGSLPAGRVALDTPIGFIQPALGDLDHDGDIDVSAVSAAGEVTVFLGTGGRDFGPPIVEGSGDPSPVGIAIGEDFNEDGWQDVALTRDGRLEVQLNRYSPSLRVEALPLRIEMAKPSLPTAARRVPKRLRVTGSCDLPCDVRVALRLRGKTLARTTAAWFPEGRNAAVLRLGKPALRRLKRIRSRSVTLRLVVRGTAQEKTSDGRRRGRKINSYELRSR